MRHVIPTTTSAPDRRTGRGSRRSLRRRAVTAAALVGLGCGLLSACGGQASATTLIWYINPDTNADGVSGQATIAANCSKGKPYTIETQTLPQDAGQQRIQLVRRLAAEDSGIDLMSIDPPYTAEFSNAGYLSPLPQELQDELTKQSFDGAVKAATWNGQLVVAPLWSNTQVLWYRTSVAKAAGLDMSQPVTWDQIIKAAASQNKTVAVQANKYEAYVVWINALIEGAGGHIATNTENGVDATIGVDSEAGRDAAQVVSELSHSAAAPPDLSVSTEGTAAATFAAASGAFMTNWTFIWHNYDATSPELKNDIGYTRYPQTVAGMDSHPPYGGIGIGVSAYSQHQDWDMEAVECLTSPENQGQDAVLTGNMPASQGGYDDPDLKKIYPQDLLDLFQASLEASAPRTVTPYWSDISGAVQSTWHPSDQVDSDTPAKSSQFIDDVLHGKKLL